MLITSVDSNVFIANKTYDILYTWAILTDKSEPKIIAALYFNRSGRDNGIAIVNKIQADLLASVAKYGCADEVQQDLKNIKDFCKE